jgi:hypothetical protein
MYKFLSTLLNKNNKSSQYCKITGYKLEAPAGLLLLRNHHRKKKEEQKLVE